MNDLIVLAAVAVFCILAIGYVAGCDRLFGGDRHVLSLARAPALTARSPYSNTVK